jgi:hypothetical protein
MCLMLSKGLIMLDIANVAPVITATAMLLNAVTYLLATIRAKPPGP